MEHTYFKLLELLKKEHGDLPQCQEILKVHEENVARAETLFREKQTEALICLLEEWVCALRHNDHTYFLESVGKWIKKTDGYYDESFQTVFRKFLGIE